MKAIIVRRFGEPDELEFAEVCEPKVGDGDVLIDVRAAAVNYPDLLVIRGQYQKLPQVPFSPGKDAAGVVAAIGPSVHNVKPGDRVVAQLEHGAYASRIAVRESNCQVLPSSMSFDDAVAMGLPYQTAHFALLERGRFTAGETVLVTGASGGVGSAVLQLVRALGGKALAAINRPGQALQAHADGASHVIDLSGPEVHEQLRQQVFAATDGRGVDVIVETLGGDVFGAALRALAWRGRAVVVGFASGQIPQIKANYLLVKNIEISGLQWSDYRDRQPERVGAVQHKLNELHGAGLIKPRIALRMPVESAVRGLLAVDERSVTGRVVLTFD